MIPPLVIMVQFSANHGGSTISSKLVAEGLRKQGFDVHVVFGFDGPFKPLLEDQGFETSIVGHKSFFRARTFPSFLRLLFNQYDAFLEFRRIFKKTDPDLVYVNSLASFIAILASCSLNIRTVCHIRELFSDVGGELRVPQLLRGLASKAIASFPDAIISVSGAVSENVLGKHEQAKVQVVHNAAEDKFFDHSTENVTDQHLTVGLPGTLRPMKGHAFFLSILPKVLVKFPKVKVIVSGSGEKKFELELRELVNQLRLQDVVEFTGTVDDMCAFYQRTDVICIPSVAEPFGRTVIESFAMRRAVVASAVGGIKEIIRHGDNGLLVDYGDGQKMIEMIELLLSNSEYREAMAYRARADAEENYREYVYQERIYGICQSLVERAL